MVTSVENILFIGIDSVVGAEDELLHFASGDGTSMRGEVYYQINSETGAVVEMWLRPTPAVPGPFAMTFDGTNIWSSDGSGSHMIDKHNPVVG